MATALAAAAALTATSVAVWRWHRRREAHLLRVRMSQLHPTEAGPEAELLEELTALYADHDGGPKNVSQLRDERDLWRKYGHEDTARVIEEARLEALREEVRTSACMKCHAPHGTKGPCPVAGVYSGDLHQWAGVYEPPSDGTPLTPPAPPPAPAPAPSPTPAPEPEGVLVDLPEGTDLQDVLDYPGGAVGWLQINNPAALEQLTEAGDQLQILFVPHGTIDHAESGTLQLGIDPAEG